MNWWEALNALHESAKNAWLEAKDDKETPNERKAMLRHFYWGVSAARHSASAYAKAEGWLP